MHRGVIVNVGPMNNVSSLSSLLHWHIVNKICTTRRVISVISHCIWIKSVLSTCPENNVANDMQFIVNLKPAAVFIVNNWDIWMNQQGSCVTWTTEEERVANGNKVLDAFVEDIKTIKSVGTKVYVTNLNVFGEKFNPASMYSAFGVVEERLKPVKRSEFRSQYKELIDRVESRIKSTGATMIDLSDDYCYNDSCEVIDRYGNPIMKDSNHFRPFYAPAYSFSMDQVYDGL